MTQTRKYEALQTEPAGLLHSRHGHGNGQNRVWSTGRRTLQERANIIQTSIDQGLPPPFVLAGHPRDDLYANSGDQA